jgi:hypothetical protein
MRKTWVLISALGLVLTGRAWAGSGPSFFGQTGLLVIPTADSLTQQSWSVHVHGMNHLATYGANYGLAKGLEVGVSGFSPQHGDTKAVINAKYNFLLETAKVPGISVGGVDIADQLDLKAGIYVVASKSLSSYLGGPLAKYNLRGHIGYGSNGIFNDDVFGGVDLQVTQNVQAIAEWINGDLNAGARLGLGKGIRVDLGSYDGRFGGGVSFATLLK